MARQRNAKLHKPSKMNKPYPELQNATSFIRAVNNKTRAKIVSYLENNPESSVTSIIIHLRYLEQPAVSSHLRILLNAGVVTKQKSGKSRLYSLSDSFVEEFYYLSSFGQPIVSPMDQIDFE